MSEELVPYYEGPLQQVKELQRQLAAQQIDAEFGSPAPKACCGGSCGCASKLQLLVRPEDVPRVASLLQAQWLEAVREQTGAVVQLGVPAKEGEEPPCPACGFTGPLADGACGDCGLQLE